MPMSQNETNSVQSSINQVLDPSTPSASEQIEYKNGDIMKRHLSLLLLILTISACSLTTKDREADVPESDIYSTPQVSIPEGSYNLSLKQIQSKLGMQRANGELGFTEKRFNSCDPNLKTAGACRQQVFSVVHFQLLCRDSEGTVQEVPVELTPLISDRVIWKIGAYTGNTQTDRQGFGQFLMLSERSVRGQRMSLRIGRQFMGFTVSEVSKVVLPKNFCL